MKHFLFGEYMIYSLIVILTCMYAHARMHPRMHTHAHMHTQSIVLRQRSRMYYKRDLQTGTVNGVLSQLSLSRHDTNPRSLFKVWCWHWLNLFLHGLWCDDITHSWVRKYVCPAGTCGFESKVPTVQTIKSVHYYYRIKDLTTPKLSINVSSPNTSYSSWHM